MRHAEDKGAPQRARAEESDPPICLQAIGIMLSQTDTQTVPPARSVDYFHETVAGYVEETQRSVESDESMCNGFA